MKRTLVWLACTAFIAACSQSTPPPAEKTPAPAPVAAAPTPPPPPPLTSGVTKQNMDTAVRAQDDFFRHTNGKWLDTFEIPADKPGYGSFTKVYDVTQEHLHQLVMG